MKAQTVGGLIVGTAVGLALGVGVFTFVYAKGASYLTNDPVACVNCHVMSEQYDGWTHSSHRSVAVCNDCHAPVALVPKYWTKAQNGFWHSFYFTTGSYSEPIRITARNREVTEGACRNCHADVVATIETSSDHGDRTSCLRCHHDVGHLH